LSILLSLPAVGSHATIVYDGSVITNACGTRTETIGIGLSQSALGSAAPGLSCSSTAQNEGAPGLLRIRAVSSISGAASFGNSTTDSTVYFGVDDLVITGPAGTASGVLLLTVDGILSLEPVMSGTMNAANDTASWLLSINSTFGSGETRRSEGKFIGADEVVYSALPIAGSFGILSGYAGGTTVVALPFQNLPTNTNLSFFLTVFGQTSAQASGCVTPDPCTGTWTAGATGDLNFMSTVSLLQGEAAFVFDQPGYLANSPSMNVQDNFWLGVPEPEAAALLLAAFAALGARTPSSRPRSAA
jgi:hypothetical protein